MATLLEVLHIDELAEYEDMGLCIFATYIDGKFAPHSQAVRIPMLDRQKNAPEGFKEFAEVDWAKEIVEGSYDGNDEPEEAASKFVEYINDLNQ